MSRNRCPFGSDGPASLVGKTRTVATITDQKSQIALVNYI
jgi:hypothetical protein